MDALVRVVKNLDSSPKWSFQIEGEEQHLQLVVKRLDISGGWTQDSIVSVRNHLGDFQLLEVPKSTENTSYIRFNSYLDFRLRGERRFWKIPPYIFQTWKAGSKTPEMEAAIRSFSSQPGYTHICWNDEQCLGFLLQVFGERYANAYNLLVPGAYRADFWRYCILYKFGGIYADAKTTVLRPLDEILRQDDELILVRDLPSTCLLNGFIACRPNHPLLGIVIEMMLKNIEARSYGENPLDITGPSVFGKAFCRWKGYPDNSMSLFEGYTRDFQMLARHEDKIHIISPEGERLFIKEYSSYYKNDVDVNIHYPQLWSMRAVYSDQAPWKK